MISKINLAVKTEGNPGMDENYWILNFCYRSVTGNWLKPLRVNLLTFVLTSDLFFSWFLCSKMFSFNESQALCCIEKTNWLKTSNRYFPMHKYSGWFITLLYFNLSGRYRGLLQELLVFQLEFTAVLYVCHGAFGPRHRNMSFPRIWFIIYL